MAITRVKAIRNFMEQEPNGRKLEMKEVKGLTNDEIQELAELCAAELGEELEVKV